MSPVLRIERDFNKAVVESGGGDLELGLLGALAGAVG